MASTVAPALLAALAAGGIAFGVVTVLLWIWYAAALSKLFPRLGGEDWKGWVPILNEVEILERGGVPGWGVVFFFIPIVQLYGLYLRIVATHRIGLRFRHGAGFTVLAVVLPPLWATLLATGPEPTDGTVRAAGPSTGGIRTRVEAARPAVARDASGYAIPAAPVTRGLVDAVPGGSAPAVRAEPPAPPAPVEPASGPVERARVAPELAPAMPAPVLAIPATAPEQHPPPTERERWVLVLDDGSRHALTRHRVVLGRNPAGSSDEQALRIPDATRTLSKTHARLDRDGSGWRLTDLGSTNGARAVDRDGALCVLAPGIATPVQGRILLGDVGMLMVLEGLG